MTIRGAVARLLACAFCLSFALLAKADGLPLEILAYDKAFTGGVNVAVGDWDGDGLADIITAPKTGGVPLIRIFSGANGKLIKEFLAYDVAFRGGVNIAVGDVNDDGKVDIITAPAFGGEPYVKVFTDDSGVAKFGFYAYDTKYRLGVTVAVGSRFIPDTQEYLHTIITGTGFGGLPAVYEFNAQTGDFLSGFYAFDPAFYGGVNVAAASFDNGLTTQVVCGAGPGGLPVVSVFDIANAAKPVLFKQFQPFDSANAAGVQVSTARLNGDEFTHIVAATGNGVGDLVRAFEIDQFSISSEPRPTRNFTPFEGKFVGGLSVASGNGFFNAHAIVAVAAAAGGQPIIKLYDGRMVVSPEILAFDAAFKGGVKTAVGDLNGDGSPDLIIAAGPGGAPVIKTFDGRTGLPMASFLAFDSGFTGGVSVAAGDITGIGSADIVVGAGKGSSPIVKVFNGKTNTVMASFFAYPTDFVGGVNVAAGDVNGDFSADVITAPGPGILPAVKAFDVQTGLELTSFFAYDTAFTSGVTVAAGDVNNDGLAEIVTGTYPGGVPVVKIFSGLGGEIARFDAFDPAFTGGVNVGVGDVSGDGIVDILVGAGPGGSPAVKAFKGGYFEAGDGTLSPILSLFAFDPAFHGGVTVSGAPSAGSEQGYGIFVGAGAGGAPVVKRIFSP